MFSSKIGRCVDDIDRTGTLLHVGIEGDREVTLVVDLSCIVRWCQRYNFWTFVIGDTNRCCGCCVDRGGRGNDDGLRAVAESIVYGGDWECDRGLPIWNGHRCRDDSLCGIATCQCNHNISGRKIVATDGSRRYTAVFTHELFVDGEC